MQTLFPTDSKMKCESEQVGMEFLKVSPTEILGTCFCYNTETF
jgi:hypothetical protein